MSERTLDLKKAIDISHGLEEDWYINMLLEEIVTVLLILRLDKLYTKTTPSPSERFTAKSVPRTSRLIPNTMGGIQKQHKKKKYNINTYRVFIDDGEMSDLQVASYAEDNKKKIRNQGHRMLTRVKRFMTCGEFFPRNGHIIWC